LTEQDRSAVAADDIAAGGAQELELLVDRMFSPLLLTPRPLDSL